MLRKWDFQLPTQIQFGGGGLDEIGSVVKEFGESALLVGYRDRSGMERTYERADRSLRDAGVQVSEFLRIPPDPDAELGLEGAGVATQTGAQVVIGLGGGSVIDAAKGIALLAKMGGALWEYTGANQESRPVTDALPVIAVPTTAGTGTEVTPVAVFTHHGVDDAGGFPLKASISSPLLRPQVALIDPELALGSPSRLTAACGADALGHAIESFMSRRANPFSAMLSGRAVAMVVQNLQRAVENPDDPDPREPLALAATVAGAAFSVVGVVMTHSIAQALGGLLHVPHGEGVAIGTPVNLRYNAEHCVEQYSQLAHYCRITADSPEERAARFVETIVELLQSIGMPDRVELPPGQSRDELAENLARNAVQSTPVPLKLNPRRIGHAELKDIFLELLSPSNSMGERGASAVRFTHIF